MAQRVMIALAIANDPTLLIADEPTTALDVTVQQQILDLLTDLQREDGLSIVLISHDLAVVGSVAHRVAVLYAGETIEEGPTARVLNHPWHPYTRALLLAQPSTTGKGIELPTIPGSVPTPGSMPAGCRFSNRCPDALQMCHEPQVWTAHDLSGGVRCVRADTEVAVPDPTQMTATMAAHVVGEVVPAAPTDPEPSGPALLAVRGLRKEYGRPSRLRKDSSKVVTAVDDVSFEIRTGETLGLVGESGAGKSTVGRMILGLCEPTTGSVEFDGVEIGAGKHKRSLALRGDIQVVFQNPYATLDPRMRIGHSVAEPIEAQGRISRRARRDRVAQLLDQVGLPPSMADRYPHALSGGQRQRVAIARALAPEPRLIVCDEPVSALDVSTQAQVINLLRRLQDEQGLTYLFVSHDLSVVYHVSHHIAVMRSGRVVEHGRADQVFHHPSDPYTKQLLASSPSALSEG